MSYRSLLNQPLTIQRRSATSTDEYGNDVPGTTSSVTTEGYVEQPGLQNDVGENLNDRETYRTEWRVFLPAGTAIDGSDRIIFGARTLEVIGSSYEPWNPRKKVSPHVVVRARDVIG